MAVSLNSIRHRFDRAGIVLSGLCALHCVIGLVLVTSLGVGGGLWLAPGLHEAGLALALVIGAISLGLGALRHGNRLPLAVGTAGLSLMALALAVSHGPAEAGLTIAGVALVAFAHIANLRHAR